MACEKGHLECVDVLLEEYPDLSVVDKSGRTMNNLLAKSCFFVHWEQVQWSSILKMGGGGVTSDSKHFFSQ